jgi:hypothetical protein
MEDQLVSRTALARELGVEPQTIAKWQRSGWFPKPHLVLSDRLILYKRALVDVALRKKHAETCARITPQQKKRA